MTEQQLRENVAQVRRRMEDAAARAGRDPKEILLCAASKTQDADTVRLAAELDIDLFGENRVQELTEKHADWAEAFRSKYDITRDNALDVVQKETGLVFAKVLEHAGVYKRNAEGKKAFLRFLNTI